MPERQPGRGGAKLESLLARSCRAGQVGKPTLTVSLGRESQILDKLNVEGKPTWFLMANGEGHGYEKKETRTSFFFAEVMFMKKYLLEQTENEKAGD
jgi:hypothetical protein